MSADSHTCSVCHNLFEDRLLFPLVLLREETRNLIKEGNPHIDLHGYICRADLSRYYAEDIASRLRTKNEKPYVYHDASDSLGDRIADKIALFGGSWTFIITFFVVLMSWIGLNTVLLLNKKFDAYPFILLNLVLSCLAAIQAPIILMSQNRQSDRDRKQAWHDYEVNLKAEMEVRHLHEKVDHMHHALAERMSKMDERLNR